MTFPKQDDIDEPLLILLFQRGGKEHTLRAGETYRPLADFFTLSDAERTSPRPKNQGPMWNSWVMMAKEQLKKHGYVVSVAQGQWRLTDAGRERARQILQNPPKWLASGPHARYLGP